MRNAQRYLEEARLLLKREETSRALALINRSISLYTWPDSYSIRAVAYHKMGRLEDAIIDYSKATEMYEQLLLKGIGNRESVEDYTQTLISVAGITYDLKRFELAK